MKQMRNILWTVLVWISLWVNIFAADLKDKILGDSWSGVLNSTSTATGEALLDSIFSFLRDSIFGLLALIAIGVFLYIWAKLITARGNPEEFKKALQSFIYAVVWLFMVAFAFAIVRLVAWVNIWLS